MSETENPDVAGNDEVNSAAARAAAASRARRIGGRVSKPSPSPAAEREPVQAVTEPVSLGKAGAAPEPEPVATTEPVEVPEPVATTEQVAVPEPVEAARPSSTASSTAILAWVPAAVLSVAALVFAILIAVDAGGGSSKSSSNGSSPSASTREQVLAAAKQCVAVANSYDYRTLDTSAAKAAACTTGKYRIDNQTTFEKVIKKDAAKLQATQSVEISVAGLESVSEDGKSWKVLLFGQVKVTNNTSAKQGRYDPEAIEATMTKVGSKWLISELIGA